jgi:predicted permease
MSLPAELRHATRALIRTPLFSVGVVVTLALALAASIVALTIVDRVLLRPLPLRDADAVVDVKEGDGKGNIRLASYPTFEDWRAAARSFSGLAFVRGETMSLGETGSRQRAVVALVSSGFFNVAGISPLLGRGFARDEERPGGGGVALISEAVWVAQFGRDPAAIGKSLHLDGRPVTIVGVVGTSQRIVEWAEVWIPLEPEVTRTPELQNRFLHVDSRVVGRLAPGSSVEGARRELAALQGTLAGRFMDPAGAFTDATVTPLVDTIVGNTRGALTALGLAIVLVLLLACANVGGLGLLRMARRQREFAVRAALGAPFRVLVRQLVTESLLLTFAAGALGSALASVVVGVLRSAPSLGIPRAAELAVDGRVLGVALSVTLAVGLVIGLLPAWRLRAAVAAGPGLGRGATTDSRGVRLLRAGVTAFQLGLALTLLVGAALLLRSFGRMQGADLGYRPEQVVAIDVYPPAGRYDDEDAARSLYRRLVDRVAAVPGVAAAGFINHTPLSGWITTAVRVPGVEPDPSGADAALYKTASEDYAGVMGLRVERGRWFTRADVDSRATGVVVSAAVARRFWPNVDPIGRTLTIFRSSQARAGFGEPEPSIVIGVVADVRHFGPANPPAAEVYLPFTREAWGWGTIVVRTTATGDAFRRSLEQALLEVEPDLPLAGASGGGFRTMTQGLETFMVPRRISTGLAAASAGLVLLVAAIGLYALAGYSVSQRTGEFGVRMALGATPGAIVRGVLRGGVGLVAAGLVLGAAGALGLGRVLASQLFETSPADPVAFAASAGFLGAALFLALWLPARRAARLDPTVALRTD